MPGLLAFRPAPELPAGARAALVIATSSYDDPGFRQLRSPGLDAAEFAEALADPDIGGFAVIQVIDQAETQIRRAVARFCASRGLDDLLLIYLSCHGVLDSRGRLFFAASDTEKQHLGATAVSSEWLLGQLDECRARRQVVVLDCCFSGAFAGGAKGGDDLKERLASGRGRAVLTASRAREYSHEGTPLPGMAATGSVFTTGLIDGLRTGSADTDRDGYITLDDVFRHAADYVREHGNQQTPQRWLYGAEGAIIIARNPAGMVVTAAPLPEALRASLDSPYPGVRIGAVNTLAEWLADDDPGRVLAAQQVLRDVADTDAPAVAAIARRQLAARAEEAPAAHLPPAPPAPEPEAEQEPEPAPQPEPEAGPGSAGVLKPDPEAPPSPEVPSPAGPEPPAEALPLLQAPPPPAAAGVSVVTAKVAPRPEASLEPAPLRLAGSAPGPVIASRSLRQSWRRRILLRTRRAKIVGASVTAVAATIAILVTVLFPGRDAGRGTVAGGSFPFGGMPTILSGHTGAVTEVAFSPDGKTLATGGADNTIWLYSIASGKPAGAPLAYGGQFHYSSDGMYLGIVNDDGTGRLWDVAAGKSPVIFTGYEGSVILAFSPTGHKLALSSTCACVHDFSNPVRLVDLASGADLPSLSGPTNGVQSLAFSPDGKILAASVAGTPLTVRLWDIASRKGTHIISGGGYPLVFSHDGKLIATGSAGGNKVQLWNVATGKLSVGLATGPETIPVAFSPTANTVLTVSNSKTATLWDASTGHPLASFLDATNMAFSPDGKYIAIGGTTSDVRLWDTRTRDTIHLAGSPGALNDLEFSGDGHYLAAASADKKTWLWH
jgi:WD40 repeat protein